MGRVLPEPVGAAQRLEVADELSHAAIVRGDAASRGEVEDERLVDSDGEREPSRGPFEADQPGDLPAEGGGVPGLPGEEMVDGEAGGARSPAFGGQREAGDGARGRRATAFPAGELAVGRVSPAGGPEVEPVAPSVRAGSGAVVEALGEQPLVGTLGARIGGEARGRNAAQREERLHGEHGVRLGAERTRRRGASSAFGQGLVVVGPVRPRPVGRLVGDVPSTAAASS